MEPKELAMRIAQVLDNKKATRVKVLRVHDLTVLADYFVIASGTSATHVKSLAEEAEFQMKEAGAAPVRTEGFSTKNWFILDYGSVIVHVFSPDARDFYDLEHLWADGEDVTPAFAEEFALAHSGAPPMGRAFLRPSAAAGAKAVYPPTVFLCAY